MLDALREFLKGPVFIFSISLSILGIVRLIYLHLYLVVKALYNSWKFHKKKSAVIRGLLTSAFPIKSLIREISAISLLKIIASMIVFALPFFVLDHLSLLEKSTGVALIALSKSFTDFLLLIITIGIVTLLWKSALKSDKSTGQLNRIWLWSFVLLVFLSGWLAANLNSPPILLKGMQVFHLLIGNILIISIPFTRIGYYIIYPLASITSHIGFWLLPDAEARDETTAYFKGLMEKQQ